MTFLKTRERWVESGLLTVDEMKAAAMRCKTKPGYAIPTETNGKFLSCSKNTEPTGEACSCGDKVEHAELSTAACCTPSQKASTIGATAQPCC